MYIISFFFNVCIRFHDVYFLMCSGVMDFYFFMGEGPNDVINQYLEVIGRPAMPPYWALGFHQCRYGYKDLKEVETVVANFTSNKVSRYIINFG